MSDLQLYLLALGLVIILGVVIINRVQERRFKTKLNQQSNEVGHDPLLDYIEGHGPVVVSDTPTEILSSSVDSVDGPVFQDADAKNALNLESLDPAITFQIRLSAAEGLCISSTGRLQEVLEMIPKRHQVWGSTRKHKEPIVVSNPDSVFDHLLIVVQLTDRNGPLSCEQIQTIATDIYSETVPTGAIATQIKPDEEAQRALELKEFSDEVDLLFGLTIERPRESLMPGEEVLSLAQALGMRLNRRGVFVMNEGGVELFTLENRDATPFVKEHLEGQEILGITFLLDVATVSDVIRTFNKMAGVAKQFADAMNASICDDNSQVITESGLDLIRQQLDKINQRMEEKEILPGSLVSKQLFS